MRRRTGNSRDKRDRVRVIIIVSAIFSDPVGTASFSDLYISLESGQFFRFPVKFPLSRDGWRPKGTRVISKKRKNSAEKGT
jgi:hypothetical protein